MTLSARVPLTRALRVFDAAEVEHAAWAMAPRAYSVTREGGLDIADLGASRAPADVFDFLGIIAATEGAAPSSSSEMRVVLNWFEELKQRVPVR